MTAHSGTPGPGSSGLPFRRRTPESCWPATGFAATSRSLSWSALLPPDSSRPTSYSIHMVSLAMISGRFRCVRVTGWPAHCITSLHGHRICGAPRRHPGILRSRAYSCAQRLREVARGYLQRVGIVPPDIRGISDWEPLARGGFATVWRARQPPLNRPVAVKVDARTLDAESERRRFLGEAAAAGNLSGHPCIVTVYDTGILADGHPYLVMRYCSGGSLTSWLQPDNRQSVERI